MIYKLTKQSQAEWIIRRLPSLWIKLNWLTKQLTKSSRINFNTMDLIVEKNAHQSFYDTINSFYTVNQVWFDENYPLYANALNSTINSLQKIINIIDTGLETYYWDNVSKKSLIADMTMEHRITLANLILKELE